MRAELAGLAIADPPERWRALGFAVDDCDRVGLPDVELALGAAGHGITGWTLRDASSAVDIDGLPTSVTTDAPGTAAGVHPNGARNRVPGPDHRCGRHRRARPHARCGERRPSGRADRPTHRVGGPWRRAVDAAGLHGSGVGFCPSGESDHPAADHRAGAGELRRRTRPSPARADDGIGLPSATRSPMPSRRVPPNPRCWGRSTSSILRGASMAPTWPSRRPAFPRGSPGAC